MRHPACLLFVVVLGCAPEAPDSRPNVLLIVADDMGFSDIGCYGGEIETPALDRLAASGLRFRQFYNGARCCPTRAMLLTGRYAHRVGIGHMTGMDRGGSYAGDLSLVAPTVAEVLRDAGYHTWMAGKWHVTNQLGTWTGQADRTSTRNWPLGRGFERFYGTITGAGSFYDPVTLVDGERPVEPDRDDFYYTRALADRAVDFVEEHAADADGRPFFGFLAFTAPHWPLHAPADAVERVAGRYDAGWGETRRRRFEELRSAGGVDEKAPLSPRLRGVRPWSALSPEERVWERSAMEVYAAQVEEMDAAIGRVLAAIDAAGRSDDTLVLFLSDNGGSAEEVSSNMRGMHIPRKTRDGRPVVVGKGGRTLPGPETTYASYGPAWSNVSNTPFRLFKHFVHEGGIATPFIVSWPAGVPAGGEWRNAVGHVIDVMSTLCELAGVAAPDDLDGESLVPVFRGAPLEARDLFWEHEGNRAMRRGRYKLVSRHRKPEPSWELYDLDADRSETIDLASLRPAVVAELAAAWQAWADRCGVRPWPLR